MLTLCLRNISLGAFFLFTLSLQPKQLTGYTTPSLNQNGTVTITAQTPDPIVQSYTQVINTAGLVDATFGTNGIVTQPAGRGLAALYIPGGGIVAGGFDGAANFRMARYDEYGSLAPFFGTNGVVTGPAGIAYGACLQPDGKIIFAGSSTPGFGGYICIARYNPNGSFDTSFNGTGSVLVGPLGSGALGVVLQPDGKIVAAGGDGAGNFCVVRSNSNGSPDTSFNTTGIVTGPAGSASSVLLQADGKIIAAGGDNAGNFAVVRYKTNGTIDTSYGNNGIATGPVGDMFAATL